MIPESTNFTADVLQCHADISAHADNKHIDRISHEGSHVGTQRIFLSLPFYEQVQQVVAARRIIELGYSYPSYTNVIAVATDVGLTPPIADLFPIVQRDKKSVLRSLNNQNSVTLRTHWSDQTYAEHPLIDSIAISLESGEVIELVPNGVNVVISGFYSFANPKENLVVLHDAVNSWHFMVTYFHERSHLYIPEDELVQEALRKMENNSSYISQGKLDKVTKLTSEEATVIIELELRTWEKAIVDLETEVLDRLELENISIIKDNIRQYASSCLGSYIDTVQQMI